MVTSVQSNNQAYVGNMNFAPTMSNDFFGQQVFNGNNTYSVQQQPIFEEPTNIASAILQEHIAKTGPVMTQTTQYTNNRPLTMNDYAAATQIANMFSNTNTPALFTNSYFMQNDYLAQQIFPPFSMNNWQAIA